MYGGGGQPNRAWGQFQEGVWSPAELVRKALKDKSYTLTTRTLLPYLQSTFASIFASNLHALASCISHEFLKGADLKPVVEALRLTFDECTAADHFEGIILSSFGLGRHHWNTGDRALAADTYANGVVAGRNAAAQGVVLAKDTRDKLEGCTENLGIMRGVSAPPTPANEMREQEALLRSIGGSSPTATRVFVRAAKPNLACSSPPCTEELATLFCVGCKGKKQRYCSSACQRLDWARHKPECKQWQAQQSAGGGGEEGKGGEDTLPSPEALAAFSVKALKAFLDAHLIDHTGCVEKSELLTLALLYLANQG